MGEGEGARKRENSLSRQNHSNPDNCPETWVHLLPTIIQGLMAVSPQASLTIYAARIIHEDAVIISASYPSTLSQENPIKSEILNHLLHFCQAHDTRGKNLKSPMLNVQRGRV